MSTIRVSREKAGGAVKEEEERQGLKKSCLLFLLLSQKRIQRFNDDTGNCRVVLWRIGFNSFRKHTGDLNVELFGDIITLIFEIFAVHWFSLQKRIENIKSSKSKHIINKFQNKSNSRVDIDKNFWCFSNLVGEEGLGARCQDSGLRACPTLNLLLFSVNHSLFTIHSYRCSLLTVHSYSEQPLH